MVNVQEEYIVDVQAVCMVDVQEVCMVDAEQNCLGLPANKACLGWEPNACLALYKHVLLSCPPLNLTIEVESCLCFFCQCCVSWMTNAFLIGVL